MSSRGHVLTYHQVEAADLALKEYGEYLFDNIILLAPKADSFGSLAVEDIVEFVRSGRNVILTTAKEVGEGMRDLAEQFGVEIDAKGTEIIDHFEREDALDTT